MRGRFVGKWALLFPADIAVYVVASHFADAGTVSAVVGGMMIATGFACRDDLKRRWIRHAAATVKKDSLS
jgi:hypothetical protein